MRHKSLRRVSHETLSHETRVSRHSDRLTRTVGGIRVGQTARLVTLELFHALHAVRRKAQFLLVAPEHFGAFSHAAFRQDLMQVGHLILAVVADQNQHGTLARRDGPFDQTADAIVEAFADHNSFFFCN